MKSNPYLVFNSWGMTREQVALGSCVVFAVVLLNFEHFKWIVGFIFRNVRLPRFALKFRQKAPKTDFIKIGEITLRDEDRMRHTHILGATGTGKSVLIDQMMRADIERGYGLIILDAKGERTNYDRLKKLCKELGREGDLHLLSASFEAESVRWNPCRLGSEAELVSKFLCSSKYDHSHYAKAAETALIKTLQKLDPDQAERVYLSQAVAALGEVTNNGTDESSKGLYFDFFNLAQGEWAGVLGLRPKKGLTQEISILDVIRKKEILYIDLPTEGKLVQSSRMGALFLQELTLISGLRKRFPWMVIEKPFSVYIDEFDAFATEPFISFLNKGRSSEFMIHMAHQTLSDLKKVSPTFEGQVTGNPNVRFIFRTDSAEDAEKIAKGFGTKLTQKRTTQVTDGVESGNYSMREVQEFNIHPDTIKSLGVGECVVSIKNQKLLKKVKIPFGRFRKVNALPLSRLPMEIMSEEVKEHKNLKKMKESKK